MTLNNSWLLKGKKELFRKIYRTYSGAGDLSGPAINVIINSACSVGQCTLKNMEYYDISLYMHVSTVYSHMYTLAEIIILWL